MVGILSKYIVPRVGRLNEKFGGPMVDSSAEGDGYLSRWYLHYSLYTPWTYKAHPYERVDSDSDFWTRKVRFYVQIFFNE